MSKRETTWFSEWNPEDAKFWESKGKFIARRNLIWSILAEHVGFSVWLIWSVVATKLPQAGFHYTTDLLFQLVALPGLVGSLMWFAVPRFRRTKLDHHKRGAAVHPDDRARSPGRTHRSGRC